MIEESSMSQNRSSIYNLFCGVQRRWSVRSIMYPDPNPGYGVLASHGKAG